MQPFACLGLCFRSYFLGKLISFVPEFVIAGLVDELFQFLFLGTEFPKVYPFTGDLPSRYL